MKNKHHNVKNIIFIGETVLLKHCLLFFKKNKKLKNKKFFLISKQPIKGVKKINIKDLEKFDNIEFLFSIINSKLIKAKILKKCKLSLNFHNGLLPKYRGLNSSSFAILKKKNFMEQLGINLMMVLIQEKLHFKKSLKSMKSMIVSI